MGKILCGENPTSKTKEEVTTNFIEECSDVMNWINALGIKGNSEI